MDRWSCSLSVVLLLCGDLIRKACTTSISDAEEQKVAQRRLLMELDHSDNNSTELSK